MNSNSDGKKIIWAFDPFEETLKSSPHLISTIQRISREQDVPIEPVHVLDFSLRKEGFQELLLQFENFQKAAQKAADTFIKDIPGISFLPARILMAEDSGLKEMIETLVQYADRTQASMIITCTHARQGLPRLFLGSFTETLLLHSTIPVLTIGPDCKSQSTPNHILFASRLDRSANHTFEKVLDLARAQRADIGIFHTSQKEGEANNPILLKHWINQAKLKGVQVNIHFEKMNGRISDQILEYAKSNEYNCVAIASESGPISSVLIGSITRQVIRGSHCPVWVVRSVKSD